MASPEVFVLEFRAGCPGCSCTELDFENMLSCKQIASSLLKCIFPAVTDEGMAPSQRILFPSEKICLSWQRRQGPGAGLQNLYNTCFLNSVLQCLTYTAPLANYLLSREHSQACEYLCKQLLVNPLGASQGFPETGMWFGRKAALLCQPPELVFFEHSSLEAASGL